MNLKSMVVLSVLMLNGCAYYAHQLGIDDHSKFCSNLESNELKDNKFYISDTKFFYLTKEGDYYSEVEFNQLTSTSIVNVNYGGTTAKELKDTSKKVFITKFTSVDTNKNLCSPTLVSSDSYQKNYADAILGRKLLISTEKNSGSSGKELYNNEKRSGLNVTFI
ncbi:hypothetical protein [Citrobacter sp. JGM124]|uniref:hypothetical protein n=1 Tax=Citrobacter sp. JGM124 TaxID=2799789 RepID=UPI001BA696C9|nr:hypothetical protein [Citrobacter sp. JGM124]MBS0849769.1 hypothetical protein [Citrobacter sp. JGM124]